jgi:hypothetical protein
MDWKVGNIWNGGGSGKFMILYCWWKFRNFYWRSLPEWCRSKGKEGLILSPSSAANLIGAIRVASELERGIVVTLLPDNGEISMGS